MVISIERNIETRFTYDASMHMPMLDTAIRVQYFLDWAELNDEFKFGRSIAVILEPIIAQDIIKKNSEIKYLTVPIPKEFQIFGVGIALKKENTKLQKQIQQAIKQLRENKTLQQLEQKWNMPGVQS